MKDRTIISATYQETIPTQHKILAADGVMGVIILLSYYGSGKNVFPEGINPEFFVEQRRPNGNVLIDIENLTGLIEELSRVIGREIGQLSVSSLRTYRSSLRKGKRANGNGKLPPVITYYENKSQRLTIEPRIWEDDEKFGLTKLIPAGLTG